MTPAPDNTIGLTHVASYCDLWAAAPLGDQLHDAGIDMTIIEIPNISGLAGTAWLVCYTSPTRGQPVTVFVIPTRADVDQWGEEYFYFLGMDVRLAEATDWIAVYDQLPTIMGLA